MNISEEVQLFILYWVVALLHNCTFIADSFPAY